MNSENSRVSTKEEKEKLGRLKQMFLLRRRPTRPGEREGVVYVRVSGDMQEDNTSLDRQLEDCLKMAEERGVNVKYVFGDVFTGSLYREREDLTQMRRTYKDVSVVIVRTFDRLSRDQTHFCVLLEELQHNRIELLCVKENFDDSAMGQFSRMALALFAQIEREKITDRTSSGKRDMAARDHRLIPGSKPLYGYAWDSEKKKSCYVLNKKEAEIVKRIFTAYKSGTSLRAIARSLHDEGVSPPRSAWCPSTLSNMLRNRFYVGEARAYRYSMPLKNRIEHRGHTMRPAEEQIALPKGTVPAIVDEETFNVVQDRLQTNKEDAARNNQAPHMSLLRAGFVKCGVCRRNMTTTYTATKVGEKQYRYLVYQCTGRTRALDVCKSTVIRVDRLDAEVWEYVESLSSDVSLIEKAIELALGTDMAGSEVRSLKRSQEHWTSMRDQYLEDLRVTQGRGARDLILTELNTIEERLEDIDRELTLVGLAKKDYEEVKRQYQKLLEWCKIVNKQKDSLTNDERRNFLRALGLVVLVNRAGEGDRYEVRASLPDIVSKTSVCYVQRRCPTSHR